MNDPRKTIKELSRELRKNSTETEMIVWQLLRNKKFMGLKFVRQYPFVYGNIDRRKLFFIADFYCAEKKLVIELDGGIHDQQTEYDENRDKILNEKGINVVRFKNEEIKNIEAFLNKLEVVLTHL